MVNQWDIYFCSLDPTQGSEQRGSRPVLVLSNDAVNHAIPVSTVAPFSSIKPGAKIYPTEVAIPASVTGLNKDSVVMLQQLRTLSHNRLTRKLSELVDEGYRQEIKEALRDYFEL